MEGRPDGRRLPSFRIDPSEAHVGALFLGPRAENEEMFSRMIQEAISRVGDYRRGYLPGDPEAVTAEMRSSEPFRNAVSTLEARFTELLDLLDEHATPYFASRYQGHMLWDTLVPGMLGYFATMLHNPNNVTVQASTLTTFLELLVGWDLCTMFGFPMADTSPKGVDAWGHITADGSVANLEAAWSARELKFLPLSIRAALTADPGDDPVAREIVGVASKVEIRLTHGRTRLTDASTWDLLNVDMEDALSVPQQIATLIDSEVADVWTPVLSHAVSTVGLIDFYRSNMTDVPHAPVLLTPATKHYSWPKALSVLGGGSGAEQLIDVQVDADARMNIDDLRQRLDESLALRRPILLTVAVMGSTEEGAVDPMDDVLAVRDEYRAKGLHFNVHADAAWGGYYSSTIRKDFSEPGEGCDAPWIEDQSHVHLSAHTRRSLAAIGRADSVTVDPHKMGYIQYPAGALCYRDQRIRDLVTFGAPVIGSPGTQVSVGEFGIEGSKPGAAPAAVYLAHATLRPSTSGYGELINEAQRSTKSFYLRSLTMAVPEDPYISVPLARLPNEKEPARSDEPWRSWGQTMAEMDIDDILASPEWRARFNEIGPDMNLVDYAFNFRMPDGTLNGSIKRYNAMQQKIYDSFHVKEGHFTDGGPGIDYGEDVQDYPLIITQTQMSVSDYGEAFMRSYAGRIGLVVPPAGTDFTLKVNRTVVMDPWLTHIGNDGRPFLDVVFGLLDERVRHVAHKAAKKAAAKDKARQKKHHKK